MAKLKVGDTIKCHDKDELIQLMQAIEAEDIHTDWIFNKDGEQGLWLVVTEVAPEEDLSVEEVKQKMCDDYCRYPRESFKGDYLRSRALLDVICANCPLNYLED